MTMCEMNGMYCAESKNVETPVDQIGQYTKKNCFRAKSVTHGV